MSKDTLRETNEKCGRHPNQNLAVKSDGCVGEKITVAEMIARSEAALRISNRERVDNSHALNGNRVSV